MITIHSDSCKFVLMVTKYSDSCKQVPMVTTCLLMMYE